MQLNCRRPLERLEGVFVGRDRDIWQRVEKIRNRCLTTLINLLSCVDLNVLRPFRRREWNARAGDDNFLKENFRLFSLGGS